MPLPPEPQVKRIVTEIEIDATPERVWQILTDFPAFPQWNPFVLAAEGELVVGSRLRVKLPGMSFTPKVLRAEPNRELRWLGQLLLPGIFNGEHYFIIEPVSDQRCRFQHGENFSGLLVPLFSRKLDRTVVPGFAEMNQALKARAEASTG